MKEDLLVPLEPDGPGDGSDAVARRRRSRRAGGIVLVALGFGGLLGAVSRYALSLAIPTLTGRFPWGTFVVNVSGSAVLGFVLVLLLERFPRQGLARRLVGTGFIGAYTTFSTFIVEALLLIRDGRPEVAVAYVAASLFAGLAAVWVGMSGARLVLGEGRWSPEELR